MKEILKENKYLLLGVAAIFAYFIFKPKSADNPSVPISTKACEDAKKLVEDQKLFLASARLTSEGMAAAKAKLAELEAAVILACSANMVGDNGFFSNEKEKLNY